MAPLPSSGSDSVLNAGEVVVLDAVLQRLIPTDELGPGACEAGVRNYICQELLSDYSEYADGYHSGLAAIDDQARSLHGIPFADLDPKQQDELLADVEAARLEPRCSAEFFALLHRHAMEGMFGDPRWGGNVDLVGWRLLGYPGPRAVWTAEEQQLELRSS